MRKYIDIVVSFFKENLALVGMIVLAALVLIIMALASCQSPSTPVDAATDVTVSDAAVSDAVSLETSTDATVADATVAAESSVDATVAADSSVDAVVSREAAVVADATTVPSDARTDATSDR
jgi:apolipoprotein N-acyltransferase